MKKIIIKKLRLLNFCGIRDAEYEFSEKLTIVSGGNGRGKSTIANAIMYVLFGTDMAGNSLDIKTFNENHEIIKEIPHEAELTLLVDGDQIVLKRTLTDSWKGSKCMNTYKYYVDGDVTTAGDFKKIVEDICPDSVFRRISSATNFCSLPWQKQRELQGRCVHSRLRADRDPGGTVQYLSFTRKTGRPDHQADGRPS